MRLLALVVLAACKRDPDEVGRAWDGPIDLGIGNPYPNHLLVDASGHLAVPDEVVDAVPPDLSRTTWRTGFSPAQTSVLRLPGIDPTNLPRFTAIAPGTGSVLLADLDAGSFLPVMAELDAYPEAEDPALLVRPLQALTPGHRIAVAVTTDAVARPDGFDALVRDDAPGNEALVAHTAELLDALEALGVSPDDVAVAWDFPVADASAPLRSALEQLEVSGSFDLPLVRHLDDGDVVVPGAWVVGQGSYDVTDFLVDDQLLNLKADGTVAPTGTARADLYVHIPLSVKDAPAGTVPVIVFGHGIFSKPELYLDDPDDPSGVVALADEGGFILVATTWRGLTFDDSVEVLLAAQDFTRFPVVPERLVQGQVNVRTLAEMVVSGAFVDSDVFHGAQGQSLPDTSRVYYYGISLGGIEGAILAANGAPVNAVTLHVGGAMWSTMLERSSNWTTFETLMVDNVPEPADRQRLYALSQLWWDPVDPATYVAELSSLPLLYQYAIGDEQVPNLTTEALGRSIGLPLLAPDHHDLYGFETLTGPLPAGSRALVQFDPEKALPTEENRPAEVTEAHYGPRVWPGARRQVIDHFAAGDEGQVIHHCGAEVCSASNPGG